MQVKLDENREVYQFQDISRYTWKERFVIRLGGVVIYALIRLIGKTVRFETEGIENFEKIEATGRRPIYGFWHDRIFLGTYFFRGRGIVVMSSQSFDAEYVARFIQRFGYGIVKGSSTRGGVGGLVGMIRLMRKGIPAGFTLDGPKGPRYVIKPGAVLLAKKTGNPIMPFVIEPKKFWIINSWDRLQIPKPFTKARVIIGEPIYDDVNADDQEIENKRAELQVSLDELVSRGQKWGER